MRPSEQPRGRAWVAPVAVGASAFGLYLATLCPTVPGGDGGELVVVAHRLGVAHPPGYPLYTWIAHAFTFLPLGSIAARVNLASAVFGAATAALLFAALRRWLGDAWAALLGSGLFAASLSVWRYSTVAEVFTLNNLFLAALVYVCVRLQESPGRTGWLAFAALAGLGLSHHHTLVLALVPLSLFVLAHTPGWSRLPMWIPAALCGLAGLLPYAYLPWASARGGLLSWGDQTHLTGFLDHVLRREYGTLQLVADLDRLSFVSNLRFYLSDASEQLLYFGLPLAIVGTVVGLRRERRLFSLTAALVLAWALYLAVFCSLSNLGTDDPLSREFHGRFWQLPNLLVCLLLPRGFLAVRARLAQRWQIVAPIAVVTVLATEVGLNYARADASRDTTVHEFGRAMLGALPPDALFLARGDAVVSAVRYAQSCEGLREDVTVVPQPLLLLPWQRAALARARPEIVLPERRSPEGAFDVAGLLDRNPGLAIRSTVDLPAAERRSLAGRYEPLIVGFTLAFYPAGAPPSFEQYMASSADYRAYTPPDLATLQNRHWAAFVVQGYWKAEQARAEQLVLLSMRDAEGRRFVLHAAESLERLVRSHPAPPAESYRSLAFAYSKLRASSPNYHERMVEVLRAFLALAPNDPQRAKIQELIDTPFP